MPRPGHLYAVIDVNYYSDARVLDAGSAATLHLAAILACKAFLTDGELTREQLHRIAPNFLPDIDGAIGQLCNVGLLSSVDDGSDVFVIRNWSEWNSPAQAVENRAGYANHVRHHVNTGKPKKGCSYCENGTRGLGVVEDVLVESSRTSKTLPSRVDQSSEDLRSSSSRNDEEDDDDDRTDVRSDDDEEEISKNAPPDRVVAVALEILVEREAKAQTERGNPPQTLIWRSRVRGERQNRHASRARLILADNPQMTPTSLANMLEPPPVQQVARPKGNEQKIRNLESSIAGLRRADPDDPEIADLERQLAELKAEQ